MFNWGSSEGYKWLKFLQFPFFCFVELAKRQWSGFCQTYLWDKSKCEQAQKRAHDQVWGVLKRGRAWKAAVNYNLYAVSRTLGSAVQLVGQTDWPGVLLLKPGLVFLRLSVKQSRQKRGRVWDISGCPNDLCRKTRWRSDYTRLDLRLEQSWMSYDAPVGSLASGLWK